MKAAVELKILQYPKMLQGEILNDIDKLQLSSTPEIFDKASTLFLEKYKDHEVFVTYFEEQWLRLHRNWYEGASVNVGVKAQVPITHWSRSVRILKPNTL